jgi:hypothetical protein
MKEAKMKWKGRRRTPGSQRSEYFQEKYDARWGSEIVESWGLEIYQIDWKCDEKMVGRAGYGKEGKRE